MKTTRTINAVAKQALISGLIGVVIISATQMTASGEIPSPMSMRSQNLCAFSLQLQDASFRQQYLAKMSGLTYSSSSAVEEMYNNIQPASYNDSSQSDQLGFFASLDPKNDTDHIFGKTSIDPLSADCLACHNGVSAIDVSIDYRNNPSRGKSHISTSGRDHPIGMDYSRYAARNKNYKPIMEGSNNMIFVDGKVGCLTCHNPMNPEREHLVMSDRNSALCLTCHNK